MVLLNYFNSSLLTPSSVFLFNTIVKKQIGSG